MKRCKRCGGTFKLSTKEHILETRHMTRPRMVIENLQVHQCSICGDTKLTEHSERLIQSLKAKMTQEMEEMAVEATRSHHRFNRVKKVFQKWIS